MQIEYKRVRQFAYVLKTLLRKSRLINGHPRSAKDCGKGQSPDPNAEPVAPHELGDAIRDCIRSGADRFILGDPKRALENLRLYLQTAQQMLERDPENTAAQFSVEVAKLKVSQGLQESGPPAAISLVRDSIRTLDQMIASNRGGRRAASDKAWALLRLGEAQLKAGRLAEAQSSANSALGAIRDLAAQNPDDRNNVVHALILSGRTRAAAGNPEQAENLLREARDEAQKMASPDELTTLIPLANVEEALGTFYAHRHRTQEAHTCYERLVSLWQQFPESSEYVDRQRTASKQLLSSLQ